MISKKSGLVSTCFGVLSFLLAVISMSSCVHQIPDDPWACNYVYCQNGGRCDSAKCKCPTGYEGKDCSIATTDKYIGTWKMHTIVWGSDSAEYVGAVKYYFLELASSASNTTFFMHNFDDNPYYNHIICRIDSNDNNHFKFDSTMPTNMFYDHYRIRGGWANIYNKDMIVNGARDSIAGLIYIRRLNATVNWQNDTLIFQARKL